LALDLIDIGSNLTHDSFAADRDAVMSRAMQAGVRRQIITGADLASSRQAAALAAEHPARLWSTAGVHPHHAQSLAGSQRAELIDLLRLPRVVAVGECGLDYFRNLSPPDAQRRAFVSQLEIAVQLRKPVFLHQRDAHADFAAILQDFAGRLNGGVAHCFTGGAAELDTYLALGLYIGITGWACDERRGLELRSSVPRIPLDKLLVETDAPYLLPRDMDPQPKSRRNEPCYLPHIAATVARLRGETLETTAAATTRNAIALFALTDL
jgi:TatD DNase family protein